MKRWRRHYEQQPWLLREYGGLPVWAIGVGSLIVLGIVAFVVIHSLAN